MTQQTVKPFYSIANTAKITGLSEWNLRKRVKDGTVKYTMSGNKVFINFPDLLKREGLTLADLGLSNNAN